MTTGVHESVYTLLYTLEYLFDHRKENEFPIQNLIDNLTTRLQHHPSEHHMYTVIRCCGFSRAGGVYIRSHNLNETCRMTNESLSALYGYLASLEEDDPGQLDYTIFMHQKHMRGCYAYDFRQIRPYILRFLYYEWCPETIILETQIEKLREDMKNLSDRIELDRYKHCCARVLHETGFVRRSNRGRCFDPVHDITKANILRHLERCHWEFPDENRPTAEQITEHYRKNGIMLGYQQRVKSNKIRELGE